MPSLPPVPRRRVVAGVAAVAAVVLAGCTSTDATFSDPPVAEESPETITPDTAIGPGQVEEPGDYQEFFSGTLAVQSQTTDGTTVAVDQAGVDDVRGWLVVRATVDGQAPGEVLGSVPLPAGGAADDITVELTPPLEEGGHTLWAGVYQDAEPVGELNIQSSDNLVANEAGDTLQATFEVTVTSAGG